MLLDWDSKITALLESIEVDPRVYNDHTETKEWVARYFGFKDFNTFQHLPEPKKIVEGMSLEMLPEHRNFELALGKDCIELIKSNFKLYNDIEFTYGYITNFIRYMLDNFQYETTYVCVQELENNNDLTFCMDIVKQHHVWDSLVSMNITNE